jgi:beta-lactamase regulating signal transducer with metallopeptidase domain
MSVCSSAPTTTDVLGIAIVHSLWLSTLAGIGIELIIARIPSAHKRCFFALMMLLSMPALLVLTFTTIQLSWILPLPAWLSYRIEGATLATWIAWLVLTGIAVNIVRFLLAMIQVALLRRLPASSLSDEIPDASVNSEGIEIRVVDAPSLAGPVTFGWLRPVVVVPRHILRGLTQSRIGLLVKHECAHIRNHDYGWNLLQSLAESIVYFQPVAWTLGRTIRREREFACDDCVMASGANGLEYARTLSALELNRTRSVGIIQSSTGAPLLQRVQRILRPAPQRCLPFRSLVFLIVFAALVMAGSSNSIVAESLSAIFPRNSSSDGNTPPITHAAINRPVGCVEWTGDIPQDPPAAVQLDVWCCPP